MSFESSLSFFIAVLIFGMTPGPGVFAILSKAMVHGAKSCLFLALGMTISDILYLIAACLGLATLATHYSGVFNVIRIIGALYLFYLAWKMWTAPVAQETLTKPSAKQAQSFIQGFLISASNPKVILFYIAFLPTFMDLTVLTGRDILLVSLLTLVALMLGLMCIAGFASQARVLFRSEQATLRLNRSAGSIMAAAGVYLLTRG